MAFSFGETKVSATKKQVISEVSKLVLSEAYKSNSTERYVVFLLDRQPNVIQLKRLESMISDARIFNYTILYSLKPFLTSDQKINGELYKYLANNESEWLDHLKDRKVDVIVPFGQAMYLITRETGFGALQPKNFYNSITTNSYFYWNVVEGQTNLNHPKAHIFPVDSIGECFPILEGEMSKFNWQSFKTKFLEVQLRQIKETKEFYTPDLSPVKIVKLKTKEEFDILIDKYMNTKEIAWDTETTGFDWLDGNFICHTLAFDDTTGYYVPWSVIDPQKLIALLKSSETLVCANGKFDTKWLWRFASRLVTENGVSYKEEPGCFYPTDGIDLLAHCIDPGQLKGLGPLSWLYTSLGGYWQALDEYKSRAKIKSYAEIPEDTLSEYAAYDAVATMRAWHALQDKCHEIDQKFPNQKDVRFTIWNFYTERVRYAYPHWIDLEYKGVYVNKETLIESQERFEKELDDIQTRLLNLWEGKQSYIKQKSDLMSTQKLGKAFMEMQFPPVETSEAGIYKTDDAALKVWIREGVEGIKDLQLLRKTDKCLKTFIGASSDEFQNSFSEFEEDETDSENGWLTLIKYHDEDKSYRLHPIHNFMGTATTRDSCIKPNLQQLTSKGDFAEPVLKNLWTKDPEKIVMLTADYSSLQARIALQDTFFNKVHCPDPGLWDVYKEGGVDDLHCKSAVGFFEDPVGGQVIEVEDENGKQYFFGGKQNVLIKRNNQNKIIKAVELNETDIICENQKIIVLREGKDQEINVTNLSELDKVVSLEVA